MSNFMTTHAIKYGDFFSRIAALSLSFRTDYQRHFGTAYGYYYSQDLPGVTDLLSPPFCERETIRRFHVAAGKINLWVGDVCSVH